MGITLCHINDIPEGGSHGFELPQGKLFGVKKRDEIFLYLNRCPHLGLPLEWEANSFMDTEGLYIKCANHGAFFIVENGECIQGPCQGDSLWSIDFRIEDQHILIDEEELPALPSQA